MGLRSLHRRFPGGGTSGRGLRTPLLSGHGTDLDVTSSMGSPTVQIPGLRIEICQGMQCLGIAGTTADGAIVRSWSSSASVPDPKRSVLSIVAWPDSWFTRRHESFQLPGISILSSAVLCDGVNLVALVRLKKNPQALYLMTLQIKIQVHVFTPLDSIFVQSSIGCQPSIDCILCSSQQVPRVAVSQGTKVLISKRGTLSEFPSSAVVCFETVVTAMCFSPDGRILFIGGKNGLVRRYDLSDPANVGVVELNPASVSPSMSITSLHYSSDGERIVALAQPDSPQTTPPKLFSWVEKHSVSTLAVPSLHSLMLRSSARIVCTALSPPLSRHAASGRISSRHRPQFFAYGTDDQEIYVTDLNGDGAQFKTIALPQDCTSLRSIHILRDRADAQRLFVCDSRGEVLVWKLWP